MDTFERSEEPLEGALPTFNVARFREKPDAQTAKEFLASGRFYWNSGIFVWKAKPILAALERFEPEMYSHIARIGAAVGQDNFDQVLNDEFIAIQGTSIDYAVMERYEKVLVVEAPYDWDDLGNWTALPKLRGVDTDGNTIVAMHLGIETKGTVVRSDDEHLIVTVGLDNCIVVRTADATLIAHKDHEASIKEVVKKLEQSGWHEYL